MTIGELAERSGLSISAIRFYQRRGLLPARDAGRGWQRYGSDALTRLTLIELAKQTGFSLDEIVVLLGALDGSGSTVDTWHALATAKLEAVAAQIARMESMRDLLADALDCGCVNLDRVQLVPAVLGWAQERHSV